MKEAIHSVTRLEVIDQTGRLLVLNSVEAVTFSLQDDNRTCKIFLLNNNPKPNGKN